MSTCMVFEQYRYFCMYMYSSHNLVFHIFVLSSYFINVEIFHIIYIILFEYHKITSYHDMTLESPFMFETEILNNEPLASANDTK